MLEARENSKGWKGGRERGKKRREGKKGGLNQNDISNQYFVTYQIFWVKQIPEIFFLILLTSLPLLVDGFPLASFQFFPSSFLTDSVPTLEMIGDDGDR
jgi:hypothetical protein